LQRKQILYSVQISQDTDCHSVCI